MKKGSLISIVKSLLIGVLFTSCASNYETIGNVRMLSPQPIKPGVVYKQLTSNSGASKKELKSSKAEGIESALNEVIEKVPGGCFMTNVHIYIFNDEHFAVSGDVWGNADSIEYVPNSIASNTKVAKPRYPKISK